MHSQHGAVTEDSLETSPNYSSQPNDWNLRQEHIMVVLKKKPAPGTTLFPGSVQSVGNPLQSSKWPKTRIPEGPAAICEFGDILVGASSEYKPKWWWKVVHSCERAFLVVVPMLRSFLSWDPIEGDSIEGTLVLHFQMTSENIII